MAIRSDRLVVSLISNQGYYTFLYRHTKHNQRVKEKNKQTWGWVSSKCKKERSLWHFLCTLWANMSMCSSENSLKATSNADLSSRVGQCSLCRSTDLSSHFSDFCSSLFSAWLSFPPDLFSPGTFCWLPSSVFSQTFLSSSTSSLTHRLFVWVSCQNRLRNRLTGTHTHQPNECPTSCHNGHI